MNTLDKILILGSLTNFSGSSLRNWEIANGLSKLGYQVTYSEPIDRNKKNKPLFPSIEYLPSPYFNLPFFLGFIPSFFYNSKLLLNNNFDVIITAKPFPHSSIPVIFFGKNSIKILDIDDLEYEYHKGVIKHLVKFITEFSIKIFPYFSTHNQPLKKFLINKFLLHSNKIFFLGQGINIKTFKNRNILKIKKLTKKLNIKKDDIVILFSAHLGPASSLSTILKSLTKIKTSNKFKLLVVGGGSYLSKYRNECKELNLLDKVIFIGQVDFNNRANYFHLADFAVNYNIDSGNEFRSPMKLREYLASKLPVITSDIGDTKIFSKYIKLIKNETELTNCFQKWINNPPSPNIAGQKFVIDNYSWSTICKKFITQIKKI